jgi:hypothetical protein
LAKFFIGFVFATTVIGEGACGGRKVMKRIVEAPTDLLMTTHTERHPEDEPGMIYVFVDHDPTQSTAIRTA